MESPKKISDYVFMHVYSLFLSTVAGYVCLRGFNRKTRIPGPLPYDLHRPISKSGKAKRSSQD